MSHSREAHEIRCSLCGFLFGYAEINIQTKITCRYCDFELITFREMFQNLPEPEIISALEDWKKFTEDRNCRTGTYYASKDRLEEMDKNISAIINIHWKCDQGIENE